jgi:hypothetical protein
MSEPPGGTGDALNAFLGWVLIVIGALIGGLGGLCTLAFMTAGGGGAGAYTALGLIPITIGGAIAYSGVMVLRSRRRVPGPEDLSRFSDGTPPADATPRSEERLDDR